MKFGAEEPDGVNSAFSVKLRDHAPVTVPKQRQS
jgi:hypothetical protein